MGAGAGLYNVRMAPLITRRRWTALVAVTPLAGQVTSTVPPVGAPSPPKTSATPQQRMEKAYADIREVSGRLSKLEVPMNVEPAFSFRA